MTAGNSDVPKRRASLQTEQTEQTEPQGQQVTGKLPASEEAINSIDDLQWSEELADNGEPFFVGENGSIDLVNIPQEVFDAIGINKSPFRLTPSMVMHVYMRHKKELKLTSLKDAVDVILDVMRNFDHVRQGKDATYIFSIENNRNKSVRRAVTFVLEYDNGEWIGIKTLGYDRISNLKNMTTLWAKGENNFATGVTTANVSSTQSLQGDQKGGIASNQRADVSTDKGSNLSSNNKGNSEKVEEEKAESNATPTDEPLGAKVSHSYEAQKIELLAGTLAQPEYGSNPNTNNSISLAKLLKNVEKSYYNLKIASYQRFFTPSELKAWVESELGDGYSVEVANEKNSGTKGLAAVVVTKNNESLTNGKTSESVSPFPPTREWRMRP